ncbi:MAG: hypothetical protein IJW28_02625 [Clostridia bacterium]|nr:hypothetical protein [Clostridia bacterium]
MAENITPESLVKSRIAQIKLKYARLTFKEKLSKILNIVTIVLMACFLCLVVLNIVDFVSYDIVYGTVANSEKEFKNGKFVGYTNSYLISYNGTYDVYLSDMMVQNQYSAGTNIKLYVKKDGNRLLVYESYKSNTALLVLTLTNATLLAGVCITNVVLGSKNKKYKNSVSSTINSTTTNNDTTSPAIENIESESNNTVDAEPITLKQENDTNLVTSENDIENTIDTKNTTNE